MIKIDQIAFGSFKCFMNLNWISNENKDRTARVLLEINLPSDSLSVVLNYIKGMCALLRKENKNRLKKGLK